MSGGNIRPLGNGIEFEHRLQPLAFMLSSINRNITQRIQLIKALKHFQPEAVRNIIAIASCIHFTRLCLLLKIR